MMVVQAKTVMARARNQAPGSPKDTRKAAVVSRALSRPGKSV